MDDGGDCEAEASKSSYSVEELRAGSYEGLDDLLKAQKIKQDFESFLAKRAFLIFKAVEKLTAGEDINATDIVGELIVQ